LTFLFGLEFRTNILRFLAFLEDNLISFFFFTFLLIFTYILLNYSKAFLNIPKRIVLRLWKVIIGMKFANVKKLEEIKELFQVGKKYAKIDSVQNFEFFMRLFERTLDEVVSWKFIWLLNNNNKTLKSLLK
jgi:hypothetical protein